MCKNNKVLQSFLLSKCDNPQIVEQWFNHKPSVSCVDFYIEAITLEKNDEIRSIALILLHKELDVVLDTLSDNEYEKVPEKCCDLVEKKIFNERIVNKTFCTNLLSQFLHWIGQDNNDEIQCRLIPFSVVVITFFALQGYDATPFWKLFSTTFSKQHCSETNTTVKNLNPFFLLQILTALVENTSTCSYSIYHIYGLLPSLYNLCYALTNISQVKIFLNFIFGFYEGVFFLQHNKMTKKNNFFSNQTTTLLLAMENKNIEDQFKPMITEIIMYLGKHIDKCSSPATEIFSDNFSQVVCLLDQFIEKNIQLFDQVFEVLEHLSFSTLQYNTCYNGGIEALFRIYFASISYSFSNCSSINDHTLKRIASKICSLFTYLLEQNVFMKDNELESPPECSAMKERENCSSVQPLITSGIKVLSDFLNTFGSNDLSKEVISMLILNKFKKDNVLHSSLENACEIFAILLEENTLLFKPFLDDLVTTFITFLSKVKSVEQENTRRIFKAFSCLLYHFHKDLIKQHSTDNVLKILTPLLLPENEFLWGTVEGMSIVYALCGFLKHQTNLPSLEQCCFSLNKGLVTCFAKEEFTGDILMGLRVIKRCITFDVFVNDNWNFYYETAVHILINIETPTQKCKLSSSMERVIIFKTCMKILSKLCRVSQKGDMNKIKFLLEYTLEKITDIYSRETDSVLFSASCNTLFSEKYLVLMLQFLTKGLGYIFDKFPQISEEFSIHTIDNLCCILKLSPGIIFIQKNETTMRSVSFNEESTKDILKKIKSNYYKEKWNVIVGQEGITQLMLKGENDNNDYIIQFNKTLLEAKIEVFQCFKTLLSVSHESMTLSFHKIVPLVLHEALGGYILLNEAALQLLHDILTSFLPNCSFNSPSGLHLSICTLPTKKISLNLWQSMTQSLVNSLLDHCLQLSSLQQCAVYLDAVKNILEVFETGNNCFMLSTSQYEMNTFSTTDAQNWIESVCIAYQKISAATLSYDLCHDDFEEDFDFCKSYPNVTRKDIQCQQTDWQGRIFTSIMCGCIALGKVFKEDFVTCFMKHLNTTFTSLLTLEKVNMKGRIAALMGYGELLHYTSFDVCLKISTLMLPICLLYIRPNYSSTVHTSPLSLPMYGDNNQRFPSDTGRIYAAIYCLGRISTVSVKNFSRYIELAVSLLGNILCHPEKSVPSRYLVNDISVSTLLQLYLNPDYAHFCEPFVMLKENFVNGYPTLHYLVASWLPLKHDKIEACNVLQLLLCILLESTTPKFAYFGHLMKSVNNCHPIISNLLNLFRTFEKNVLNQENPCVMTQIHKAIYACENWGQQQTEN